MRPSRFAALLGALLLASATLACEGSDASPSTPVPSSTPTPVGAVRQSPASPRSVPQVDLEALREDLGPKVWSHAEAAAWFDAEDIGERGVYLLAALGTAGPLNPDNRLIAVIDAYPEGLDPSVYDAATTYARLTFDHVLDVLDQPWLVDGLDAYESAVLALVTERVVSPSALRLSLRDGFFRPIYVSNPDLLSSRMIDAIGTLSPDVLARAQQEPWFRDGLDEFDVSLLGVLAEFVSVQDAFTILEEQAYLRVELENADIAVVFFLGTAEEREDAFALVESAIYEVESFAGRFQPLGLLLDFTPIEDYIFCHGDGGSEFSVGYIGFTGAGCFASEVVTHELAHAFIGGSYPDWFTEGAAELVAYHVEGFQSGYIGGRGDIDLEGFYFTGDSRYLNQGSLGADFLVDLYRLAGEDEVSAVLRDVAGQRLTGRAILERIRQIRSVSPAEVASLIAEYFSSARPELTATPTPRIP